MKLKYLLIQSLSNGTKYLKIDEIYINTFHVLLVQQTNGKSL